MSKKVYQRKNGSFYVKPEEFVRSDEGQGLLQRFLDACPDIVETGDRYDGDERDEHDEAATTSPSRDS